MSFVFISSISHYSNLTKNQFNPVILIMFCIKIFCIDGDGSVIMHMGALPVVGQVAPANLKHIIINNGTHDSVGGQPSAAQDEQRFQLTKLALACGYKEVCAIQQM
jgi:phosphonopyruvate decarboxylase